MTESHAFAAWPKYWSGLIAACGGAFSGGKKKALMKILIFAAIQKKQK